MVLKSSRNLYAYDEQGFRIQSSDGGSTYQCERDTEGNTLRKSAWGRTLYEAAYDACGRIAMLDRTYYHYDKAGRLKQVMESVQYTVIIKMECRGK